MTTGKFDLEKRAAEMLPPGGRALACALAREAVAAARAEWEKDELVAFSDAKRKAADERAEEIDRLCRSGLPSIFGTKTREAGLYEAAAIARSTIKTDKPGADVRHPSESDNQRDDSRSATAEQGASSRVSCGGELPGDTSEPPAPSSPGEWVDGPPPTAGRWWTKVRRNVDPDEWSGAFQERWTPEEVRSVYRDQWRHWSVPITPAPKPPETRTCPACRGTVRVDHIHLCDQLRHGTREQRLEKALRFYAADLTYGDVAREALEGKP